MTKPLFTIMFTPEQAIDFIKKQIKDNYSSLDEFDVVIKNDADVVIQQKPIPDFSGIIGGEVATKPEAKTEVNPWLIPDADGWFTHDPEWKSEDCPPYIAGDRKVSVILSAGTKESYPDYADAWYWTVDNPACSIVRWKYVD